MEIVGVALTILIWGYIRRQPEAQCIADALQGCMVGVISAPRWPILSGQGQRTGCYRVGWGLLRRC